MTAPPVMPTPTDYFALVGRGAWRNRTFADYSQTPNFQASEFACPCRQCGRDGAQMDHSLVMTLQRLRDTWGNALVVSSGLRCPEHNRLVGGAHHSAHLYGRAADLAVGDGLEAYRLIYDALQHGHAVTGVGVKQHGGAGRLLHLDNCQPGEFKLIARPRIWSYA